MVNLVLCGGIGSRLWPLSRNRLPKQFARILPERSFFEATVIRNREVCNKVFIASNRDQAFLAANQLGHLDIHHWQAIIEPEGRNTAPAIALTCFALEPEELVLVCPSDHVIKDTKAYTTAVKAAMDLARSGMLVTFGIKPEFPETGFGYIEADDKQANKVKSFKEKPNRATAEAYVKAGNFYWNSGIFCFKAGVFLSELQKHAPGVYDTCKRAYEPYRDQPIVRPSYEDMMRIPSISIDYAVLEKSDKVAVVPCSIGWSDLGSYDALFDYLMEDSGAEQGSNALLTSAEPVIINSKNNLVLSRDATIALINVDDLLVVQSPDAILISRRGHSQDVKKVVDELKARKSGLVEAFSKVERPWGHYSLLDRGPGYQIGRVEVEPGKRISLHSHDQREEQWTVIQGTLHLETSEGSRTFQRGESVNALPKTRHRISNPGNETLVLVETRTGELIFDDDIVRIESDYEF